MVILVKIVQITVYHALQIPLVHNASLQLINGMQLVSNAIDYVKAILNIGILHKILA